MSRNLREPRGNFTYHQPSPDAVLAIQAIRNGCRFLHGQIEDFIPQCREKELAVQKLEEVSMWANKAIVLTDTIAQAMKEDD